MYLFYCLFITRPCLYQIPRWSFSLHGGLTDGTGNTAGHGQVSCCLDNGSGKGTGAATTVAEMAANTRLTFLSFLKNFGAGACTRSMIFICTGFNFKNLLTQLREYPLVKRLCFGLRWIREILLPRNPILILLPTLYDFNGYEKLCQEAACQIRKSTGKVKGSSFQLMTFAVIRV